MVVVLISVTNFGDRASQQSSLFQASDHIYKLNGILPFPGTPSGVILTVFHGPVE
jgi:hypothetical protein